jgi:hypothetical protein
MKTKCLLLLCWLLVAVFPFNGQENVELRSSPKETGPAIYCEGALKEFPPAKVRVTILNPINGSYSVGQKIPVDIEIRNTGDRQLIIPVQPKSENLFGSDEKFPLTLFEMCIHVEGDETYSERCLSSRSTRPDSFIVLQPDHSVVLQDTFEVALLKPESYVRAAKNGYTMSLSTYVSFSAITVTSVPRKLYNDCFFPAWESDHSNLASITITVPTNKD